MIVYKILLPLLYLTLAAGVIALVFVFRNKDDSHRFDKMSSISSFMTSVAAIIIGVVTISIMKLQEDNERLQNQPIFEVSYQTQLNGDGLKRDYSIRILEGRVRGITHISEYTFLEFQSYKEDSNHRRHYSKPKYWFIDAFFGNYGVPFYMDSKVDTIALSRSRMNNFSYFYKVLTEVQTRSYPYNVDLLLDLLHCFEIDYLDVLGIKRTKYIVGNQEVTKPEFMKIKKGAVNRIESKGVVETFGSDIEDIALDDILEVLYPDI